MAHYAIIDPKDNIVVQVITGVDEDVTQTDLDGTVVGGSTEAWEAFYESQDRWKNFKVRRTSFNGNFRRRYAGIGMKFDEERDAFISLQPHPSWSLNEETLMWEPPTPMPADASNVKRYWWNENALAWEERRAD